MTELQCQLSISDTQTNSFETETLSLIFPSHLILKPISLQGRHYWAVKEKNYQGFRFFDETLDA